MTKPESQKTGMETTAPVTAMASAERASPSTLSTASAITRAPPFRSRMKPMMVPAAMTMPMLLKVPPKPDVMAPITSLAGNPATNPTP